MVASSLLPIKPTPDSPLFRASVASLDAAAHSAKRFAKHAYVKAQAVADLLAQLELAEEELYDALELITRHLTSGNEGHDVLARSSNGSSSSRDVPSGIDLSDNPSREVSMVEEVSMEAMRGARRRARDHRRSEREKLEHLVQSKLRALRSDIKDRHVGDGRALQALEETTKVYYQTVSKHLAPHSGLQSADVAALDARQRVVDAEFELRRYTAHSAFLWAAPPYSLAGLQVAICACTWYSGLLPETFDARTGALTSPSTPPVPFPLTHDKIISRKRSEPSLRAAAQTVAGDPDSLQSIKRSLSQTLSSLGRRKDQLEIAWAQREDQQGQLERHLQSLVEQYRHSRSLSTSASIGRMPGAESAWDISRLARGSATEKEKHKKGVGHRLRGMITSASQYGGLSSKARDSSAVHTPEPGPTELAKQSTRQSASGTSSASHNALDNSTNASHAGTGSVLENGGYESPFRAVTRRPSSVQDSPLEEDVAVMPAALHPAPQRPTTAIRDLQMASGAQVAEDEMQRELAGRKREGLLWSPNTWEDIGGSSSRQMERKDRGRWDQFWVVLAASKIYEYRDGLNGKAQHPHEVIDLRFASAREGRDTDRRFTFEVVTPSRGKRMYQATSAEDMRSWIYAIGNAVQSCLNGTATLQGRTSSGIETVDDLVLSGGGHGFTSQMHSGLSSRALKGMSTPAGGISSGWHRQVGRRVSLKEALRQSKHSLGFDKSDKRPSTITVTADGEQDARQQLSRQTSRRRSRGSLGIPNPPFLGDSSRQSSNSSQTSSKRLSWMSNRSVSPSPPIDRPLLQTRGSSSQLEAYSKLAVLAASASNGPEWLTDSLAHASADVSVPPDTTTLPSQADIAPADMIMLRKVADQPGNQICADCKRPIKGENSQRWATINLRGHPMVMFLCIRCAGFHRSLGTHISKVRSPDLDHWTDEMILTARAWGNARGNAIWERNKPENVKPADDSLAEIRRYIEDKYVSGQWLSADDRQTYLSSPTLAPGSNAIASQH